MKELRDKKALVTGAGVGIGRSIALALAHQGVNLWLLDCDIDSLEQTQKLCQSTGVEIVTDHCDLTDHIAIARTVATIKDQWKALHLLINNAGLCYYGKTRDMRMPQWELIQDVNIQAPFRLIHGLLPLLEEQDEAHVATICSMYGLVSYRKQAAYQASKFAMVGLMCSLRLEYAGTGLGFSAICPGYVRGTRFFDAMETPKYQKSQRPPAWITCSPETVAKRTLGAIRHNRAIVVITALARWQWLNQRFCPGLIDRLLRLGFGYKASKRRKQRSRIR